LEMVQENKIAARLANALHFFHDGDGVRNCRNKIRGENAVKTGIGKLQFRGVHLQKANFSEAQQFGAFLSFFEHALGEIDASKFDVAWQQWQRKAGADAYFQE